MMKKRLFLLMLLLSFNQIQAASLAEIKKNDTIRVGIAGTKPPFSFIGGEEGDGVGFEADLARAMAEDLLGSAEKIDFIPLESSERIPALENDEVDVVLANFTVTAERKEKVDFAKPYIKTRLGVISPAEKAITKLEQLNGKTLIVPEGTIAAAYFQKHYPAVKLKSYADNASAFHHFGNYEGDALSQDNTLLFPWVKEKTGFVVGITGFGDEFFIAPAVQKGNQELLDFVNAEIEKFRNNGVINAAYEKHIRPAFGDSAKKEDILVLQ